MGGLEAVVLVYGTTPWPKRWDREFGKIKTLSKQHTLPDAGNYRHLHFRAKAEQASLEKRVCTAIGRSGCNLIAVVATRPACPRALDAEWGGQDLQSSAYH